jgi:hypothetical protein
MIDQQDRRNVEQLDHVLRTCSEGLEENRAKRLLADNAFQQNESVIVAAAFM